MADRQSYFVGADVGTTGTRVSIYSATGELVVSASEDYPLHVPKVGWAEQNPEGIFQAFLNTFKKVVSEFKGRPADIKAVSLSTVFHSLFPVDSAGQSLYPMLIFADTRAQECLPEIRASLDTDALYQRTGCPLHPMYPLAKLFWFRKHQPKIFDSAHKFVSIKDFLIFKLSGRYEVDRSIASGSGLFHLEKDCWDEKALQAVRLDINKLSTVRSTTGIVEDWSSSLVGLPRGIPLVLGAGDGVLSSLGAGAIGPGQYTAMVGTSGAVRLCTDRPRVDSVSKNWCYNLSDEVWVMGGAINNGGLAFRWARDKFARTEQYVAEKLNLDVYDVLGRYAEQKPAGSDGLIFLPFLSGERSPHWNANARGVLFGLNLNHGKRHLVRATLEGVCFSMYSVFKSLRPLSGQSDEKIEVRASGSFTRSSSWVQMMADVFGAPIVLPSPPEGSAFGAAALGMLATGQITSLDAIKDLVGKPRAIYQPNPSNHALYGELFQIYERVYSNLIKEFDDISKIQGRLSKE